MDGETSPVPVVLITGQLLTGAVWAPVLAELGARFEFIQGDWTGADSIAKMATRMLAEAPRTFDLVAHAMGGFVAFEVMRRAPERVRRLVLISTLAAADTPAQTERRLGYLRLVEQGRFADIVAERVPILLPPARRSDSVLVDLIRDMALETGAERFLAQQRAIMTRLDSEATLAAITCPTLILRGDQDGITSEDHLRIMTARIPNSLQATVTECGHLPTLEQPAETCRLLAAFLTDDRSVD